MNFFTLLKTGQDITGNDANDPNYERVSYKILGNKLLKFSFETASLGAFNEESIHAKNEARKTKLRQMQTNFIAQLAAYGLVEPTDYEKSSDEQQSDDFSVLLKASGYSKLCNYGDRNKELKNALVTLSRIFNFNFNPENSLDEICLTVNAILANKDNHFRLTYNADNSEFYFKVKQEHIYLSIHLLRALDYALRNDTVRAMLFVNGMVGYSYTSETGITFKRNLYIDMLGQHRQFMALYFPRRLNEIINDIKDHDDKMFHFGDGEDEGTILPLFKICNNIDMLDRLFNTLLAAHDDIDIHTRTIIDSYFLFWNNKTTSWQKLVYNIRYHALDVVVEICDKPETAPVAAVRLLESCLDMPLFNYHWRNGPHLFSTNAIGEIEALLEDKRQLQLPQSPIPANRR